MLLINKKGTIDESQQFQEIAKKITENHYLNDESISLNDKILFIQKNYFNNTSTLSYEEFKVVMDNLILFANQIHIIERIFLKLNFETDLDFESMFLFFYKNSTHLSAFYNKHISNKKVIERINYLFGNSLSKYLSNKIQKGVFHKQINNHILFAISKEHLNTFVTLTFHLQEGIQIYQSYDFSFLTDFTVSLFKVIGNEPLTFNQNITLKEIKRNGIHKILGGLLNFNQYAKKEFENYSQHVLRYEEHLTPNLFLSYKQKKPIRLSDSHDDLASFIKKVDYHLVILVRKTSDFYYDTSYSYYQYHEMTKLYEGLVNKKFNLLFTIKYILMTNPTMNSQQLKYNEKECNANERVIIRKFFKLLSNFNLR